MKILEHPTKKIDKIIKVDYNLRMGGLKAMNNQVKNQQSIGGPAWHYHIQLSNQQKIEKIIECFQG